MSESKGLEEAGEQTDDVSAAIDMAKTFLLKAFRDERIENVGFEEIRHDHGRIRDITLGFTRRWDGQVSNNAFLQATAIAAAALPRRVSKVVKVDLGNRRGISIINRAED